MNKPMKLFAASVFAASISITPALSFVLTNKDDTVHSVELIEDIAPDTVHTIDLVEGGVVRDLCNEGCLVRIEGQEYSFFGDEEVVIEENELFILTID